MKDNPRELAPSLAYINSNLTVADWRGWCKHCQPKRGASLPFATLSELKASHQAWQASTRPTKNKGKAALLECSKDNAALEPDENDAALEHQEEPMAPRRSSRTQERLQKPQERELGQRAGHTNSKKRPRDDDPALAANKKQKRRPQEKKEEQEEKDMSAWSRADIADLPLATLAPMATPPAIRLKDEPVLVTGLFQATENDRIRKALGQALANPETPKIIVRYDWNSRNDQGTFAYTAFACLATDSDDPFTPCVQWHRETFNITSINILIGVGSVCEFL
jgi:hypothetical protein